MRVLDGNATLPYREPIIHNWLSARAAWRKGWWQRMAVTAVVGGSAVVAGIGLARMNARGMERATVGSRCVAAWHSFSGGICEAARSLALRRRA